MSLSETKAKIRHAKRLMRELRQAVNWRSPRDFPVAINLARHDYDALEWGMGRLLKAWVYDEYDSDGEPVKGSARLVRIHGTFTLNDGTDNFAFKGLPVRCAEPIGLVSR